MYTLSFVCLFVSAVFAADIPSYNSHIELKNPFPNCLTGQNCSPHDPIQSCQTIVHYNGCVSEICSECYPTRVRVVLNSNDTVEWASMFWKDAGDVNKCRKDNEQEVDQFILKRKVFPMQTVMSTEFNGDTCGLEATFDPKGFQGQLVVREHLAGFDLNTPSLQYISYTLVTVRCCAQSEINPVCMPIVPIDEDVTHCAVQTFELVPGHSAAGLPASEVTSDANRFKFTISMTEPAILEDSRVSWYVSELKASCDASGATDQIILIDDGDYTPAANALQILAQRPITNKGPIAFSMSAFHCCGNENANVRFSATVEFCQIGDALSATGCVKRLCKDIPSYSRYQSQGRKMLPEAFVMGGSADMELGEVVLGSQL